MPLSFPISVFCTSRGAGNIARNRLPGDFFGLREIPRTRHAPAESRRQPGLAAPQFAQIFSIGKTKWLGLESPLHEEGAMELVIYSGIDQE